MAKKILALCVSVLMVMSLFSALPVSAETALPENIGADYEATDVIEGNLFTDLDTVSGYTPANSHTTGDTWVDGAYVHEKIVLEGETLDTESALYKRGDVSWANWEMGNGFTMTSNRDVLDPWSVYTDEDSDGIYTLDESAQSYKRALAGVQLKVMDVTYGETVTATTNKYPTPEYTRNVVVRVPLNIKSGTGTAKVNIARSKYQSTGPNYYTYTGNQASDHEYPIEYNGRDQGIEVAADGKTYLVATFAGNTTATSDPRYSYTLGMVEGTDAGITVYVSDEDYYIGYEYAKDLIVEADNTNLLAGNGNIKVSAEVLNQLGTKGGLSQGVTWYALNAERNAVVDGITIVEGTDGTATVSADSTVASGTYIIVAVANENDELVKGIQVTVYNVDLSKDYVAGAIKGNLYNPVDGEAGTAILNSGSLKGNADGDMVITFSKVIGDGIDTYQDNGTTPKGEGAATGAQLSKTYTDFTNIYKNGETFIVGAQIKKTDGNPKFTAGFWQANKLPIRPRGYGICDGYEITSTEFEPVCLTIDVSNARSDNHWGFNIGFPEDPAGSTDTSTRTMVIKKNSFFIGYEQAHDIKVSGGGEVFAGKYVTVDADIVNQLGVVGNLSQGVTWVAMNKDRTEKVSGFKIIEGADGTAKVTVDSSVATGKYMLVAVADEDSNLVKGIEITVKNIDLSKDYVAGDIQGNLYNPVDGEAGVALLNSGSLSGTANGDMSISFSKVLGDGVDTYQDNGYPKGESAAIGGMVNKAYTDLAAVYKEGATFIVGAQIKKTAGNPKFTAGFWQANRLPIRPRGYGVCDGYEITSTEFETVCLTIDVPSARSDNNWGFNIGMPEDPAGSTDTSQRTMIIKKNSFFIGYEQAHDMNITVTGSTKIAEGTEGTFTVDANITNQLGVLGNLSQNVTWYAMNYARTEIVEDIQIVAGENGTATVTVPQTLPAGGYKLVAVADDYQNIIKSVLVEVKAPIEDCYEKSFDSATYIKFEADVYYNGTSVENLIYAQSTDTLINLFNIFDGKLSLGASFTETDTPIGWYNVKIRLDDINQNAVITVTTPDGAVIERADPNYIGSASSIDKIHIGASAVNYKNISVNTTYTAPVTPEDKAVSVEISSVTENDSKVLGVAQLAAGDKVALNLAYKNITAEKADYIIMAAYYAEDGKLLTVEEVKDQTAYTIADMTNVDEISFFVWDSFAAIKPLGEKYVIGDMKFTDDEVYGLVTTFYGDEGTTRGFSWTADAKYTDMVIQYAEADQNWDKAYTEKEAVETEYEGLLYYKTDISGLTAGKTYVYRIGDSVDDVWSETYRFTTEAENIEEFTFLGITDSQSVAWTDGFEYTAKALNVAFAENPNIAFTVNVGDIVNNGPNESEWKAYFKALEGKSETLPHMAVVGNHETRGDEFTAVKNFSLHFNNPKNGADAFGDLTVEDTKTIYGDGIIRNQAETVYSFDYGNAHFAVLNTGTDYSYGDVVTILTEQAKWLDKDLAATDKQWKIVLLHQSMYPSRTHDRYDTKAPLLEVIDKHNVDLVLQGHDHVVARTYPMRGDEIVTKSDINTVTKGMGTVYNIIGKTSPSRDDVLINTPEYLAVYNAVARTQPTYTVFKVDADSIDVVTKQANGLIVDEYSIVANTLN